MDVAESLEADWIQIRKILKAQLKQLETGQKVVLPGLDIETTTNEARERARNWITECEKIISRYSIRRS